MLPPARTSFPYQETHDQQHATGATGAGEGAEDRVVMQQRRQQWDARLASFRRGLDHVTQCSSGDACGSSLCHATKRLMRTYATHDCVNPSGGHKNGNENATECKVCKLWGYILTKNKPSIEATRRPLATIRANINTNSTAPSLSCGMANARRMATGGLRGRPSAQRRVVVTQELIKAMAKRV